MAEENAQSTTVPKSNQVSAKEIFAWAMFDFANSSYSVVVMTTIFNTYFVGEIAGGHTPSSSGLATLLWTLAVAISNLLIVLSAPIIGAFADHSANKKRLLSITTVCCAVFTALLSLTHAGMVPLAVFFIVMANFAYGTGENLIAAFLTEIASREKMGRISAIGIALGYFGGPVMLALCLAYIHWAQQQHHPSTQFVPICMVMVAIAYVLGTMPTFFWLKERAVASKESTAHNFVKIGFDRLRSTIKNAAKFQDLFRFLLTLVVFSCGTATVIVLAAIYAQQVIGFGPQETIVMILVVNVTAAIGAFAFGHLQDKIGSVSTLKITLSIWALAITLACFINSKQQFWCDAFLIGVAMGSTQSTARALIGQFSPPGRSAEFFGLWGLAVKFASIIGPVTFGLISFITNGNQRMAILSTAVFFIAGFILMTTVNEKRGIAAAIEAEDSPA
jgi:UMF1 family MFS transporter